MIKEFIIGDVFKKINTLKIKGKANDFPTEPTGDYVLPLLTAGVGNQGLTRFAKRIQCPTILSNCISVSANGNSGVVFYHPEEFAVLQDSYAIKVRNYKIPNAEVGLYLTSALYKAIADTHDWNYKAGWNRIKEDIVSLPVKIDENGNPVIDDTHFYHEEGFIPDWDYMQERIEELMQERIEELMQERIEELEKYLVATGLNDYELTKEDIETLSASELRKEMKEFRMGDLFVKQDLKWKSNHTFDKKSDLSTEMTDEFNLPLCNAKNGNNGIMYYGRDTDFDFVTGGIDIVNDGAVSTGNVYPQPDKIGVLYNAYIITLKNEMCNRLLFEYLSCCIEKTIKYQFGYSNKATWEKVKIISIPLPIQTEEDGQPVIDDNHTYHSEGFVPDWDYMERYIKAIEKLVIKDVVDFKDEMISKTKKAVAKKGTA